MVRYRFIDLIKEDHPYLWWMAFVPSVVFYGTLVYLFIAWLGYRADMRALEERYQQAKLQQAQRRSVQRYKQQLNVNASRTASGTYDDSVTNVAGW